MSITKDREAVEEPITKPARGAKAPKAPKAPKASARNARDSAPRAAKPQKGRDAGGRPPVARVDLLPPIVEQRRKQHALERMLVFGLLVLAVVAVAATFVVSLIAFAAEARLAEEEVISAQLKTEEASFSEVSTVKTQLVDYDTAELAALYAEADWGRLMRELDGALPADVEITSESIRVKGADPTGTPPEAGLGLDNLGVIEITYTVTGPGVGSTTQLLNGLQSLTGYASATAVALVNAEDRYSISGTIQLNAAALGGTVRTSQLNADDLLALHDALEVAATTPAAPPAPTDDTPIAEGKG